MKMRSLAVIACLLLAACGSNSYAPPPASPAEIEQEKTRQYEQLFDELVRDKRYRDYRRLAEVTYPVMVAASPFCADEARYHYGFMWFDPAHLRAAGNLPADFTLTDGLGIAHVTRSLPEALPIRAGDRLLAVNGASLAGMRMRAARDLLQEVTASGQPMTVRVAHQDGAQAEYRLTAVHYCPVGFEVVKSNHINAYTDGDTVFVTRGMMRFAKEEHELGLVVAHELAHTLLDHRGSKIGNAMIGAVADALLSTALGVSSGGVMTEVGARAFSQSYESEADYLGLYILRRAGVAIDQSPAFWRRMGVREPDMVEVPFLATHPSAPERYVRLSKAIAEIQAKEQAGLPLLPEAVVR